MTGDHTSLAGPASRRTRVLPGALLAPFVVLAAVGLVLLWPGETDEDLGGVGAPRQLVDATVSEVREGPCQGTPVEAGLGCSQVTATIEEGPDAGTPFVLQVQPDNGALRLERGDRIVLGYFPDAPPEFRYAFADRQRRGPLYVLVGLFVAVLALTRAGWSGPGPSGGPRSGRRRSERHGCPRRPAARPSCW